MSDRFTPARRVADEMLSEVHVLPPYRTPATTARPRWPAGVLVPRAWREASGSQRWSTRTECVLDGGDQARVEVRVRLRQRRTRTVETAGPSQNLAGNGGAGPGGRFWPVATHEVDGVRWAGSPGAVHHEIELGPLALDEGVAHGHRRVVELPGARSERVLRSARGAVVGRVVTVSAPVSAAIEVEVARWAGSRLARVTVTVANLTPCRDRAASRSEVLSESLLAVHTMVAVSGGRFFSRLDPPEQGRAAVGSCRNQGSFPVLAGAAGSDDLVLSLPFDLGDHPEMRPGGPGDGYDGDGIDDALARRMLALPEEWKDAVRAADCRAADLLARCEAWEDSTARSR